jgi:bifunctional UDP-N-acetylglucosamine pyrophosphorylase/glucosamine-1-phosphate N-acetyltransferase
MSDITVILLAAGNGTRMKSNLIKVMHPIAGKPMIAHVVDNAIGAGFSDIVLVVGFQQERLRDYFGDRVRYAVQTEQLGTGHAVQQATPFIEARTGGHVLVMNGDNPFLGPDLINRLVKRHIESGANATLLTAELRDPSGLGRVIRNPTTGRFAAIVEEKDATAEQKRIGEIYTGVGVFKREGFVDLLNRLDNNNAQKEYYLPQTVELLIRDSAVVEVALEATEEEAIMPNNRVQLAEAEARIRWRIVERHMLNGVTIVDPKSTYIDEEVEIGRDTTVWPMTFLQGKTVIGSECKIGPGTTIVDAHIADGCRVEQSVVEQSVVGPYCQIGPMAHLRPGCELEAEVEVGNYAELKKAKVARGVKCHHHSYLGDVIIGENANIGAGVITANYNGFEKYKTDIGANAFIGTNVNLIAPVKVGEGALVAAGSSIGPAMEVPANALIIERAESVIKEGTAAKLRARNRAKKERNN